MPSLSPSLFRSPLIAGAAALVGAGAVAVAPPATQHGSLPSLQMPVTLASVAFDQPITELLGTLDLANSDLFSSNQDCLACAVNDGPLTFQGMLPQFIGNALPIIRQLGYNGAGYLGNTIEQLLTGPDSTAVTLAHAAWTFLPTVANAGLGPALSGLGAAINQAGHTALGAGQYVLDSVVTNLTATAKSLVGFLPSAIASEIGIVKALVAATVNTAQQVIAGLAHLGSGQSWNALVAGLLGPMAPNAVPSIPGALEALTIGQGLNDTLTAGRYVPSIRVIVANVVNQHVLDLNGETSPHPHPVASVTSATAAAVTPAGPKSASARQKPATVASSVSVVRTPKAAAAGTARRGSV